MAEIPLESLLSTVQIQAVSGGSATAKHSAHPLPPELSALPQGATLKGFVLNREASGEPILRTPQGDFHLKTPLFLKTGSEVTLRLTNGANMASSARIISVDNVPLQTLIANQKHSLISGDRILPSPLAGGIHAGNPASAAASLIQGVMLQPAQFGTQEAATATIASILKLSPAEVPQLERGLPMQFRILSSLIEPQGTTTPAAATGPTRPVSSPLSVPLSQHYSAYSHTATDAGNPAAPTTPAPTANSPQAGIKSGAPTLSARVIGHEGPELILRTSIGTIKLFTSAALPTGSQLQLEFVAFSAESASGQQTAPASRAGDLSTTQPTDSQRLTIATSKLSTEWDSLKETEQLLKHDAPEVWRFVRDRLPNTRSTVVNHVLFFLSALRGNDFQRWFGKEAMQHVEDKSSRLLQRLSNDFSNIRMLASEQPDQHWQMLLFPLLHEDELHQARLFTRYDHSGSQTDSERDDADIRLLLEVHLSQLGTIQIDGLVHRQQGKAQQLDIVIRSETTLDDSMKRDIKTLYHNASEITGLQGQLHFLAGPGELITPLQELREHANEYHSIIV